MSEPERKTNLRAGADAHAVHDVGGLSFGPVDRAEHPLSFYEQRVDAMLMLLVGPRRGAFKVDALRRAVEDFSQSEYDGTPYYDRWVRAIRNLLVEQEVLTREEIEERIGQVSARLAAEGRAVSEERVP
jgi:nitrile hydratase